jgi:hypothetical protein
VSQPIELRAAPHQHSGRDVPTIMRNVVYSMLPICAFSVWQYGLSAAALILVVTASCLLQNVLRITFRVRSVNTLSDWSAAITGIILALTLPPAFPFMDGGSSRFFGDLAGQIVCSAVWDKILLIRHWLGAHLYRQRFQRQSVLGHLLLRRIDLVNSFPRLWPHLLCRHPTLCFGPSSKAWMLLPVQHLWLAGNLKMSQLHPWIFDRTCHGQCR